MIDIMTYSRILCINAYTRHSFHVKLLVILIHDTSYEKKQCLKDG